MSVIQMMNSSSKSVFLLLGAAAGCLLLDSVYIHGVFFLLGWAIFHWLRLASQVLAQARSQSKCAIDAPALKPKFCPMDAGQSSTSIATSPSTSSVAEDSPEQPRSLPTNGASSCRSASSPPSPSPAPISRRVSEVAEAPPSLSVERALLAAGLGAVLQTRCSPQEAAPRQWPERCGESSPVGSLPAILSDAIQCSDACLPLALVYLDRYQSACGQQPVRRGTCRRVLATALVLARKFHDDETPYSNQFYAEVGGMHPTEFACMEREFCRLMAWRFHVETAEFERYRELLHGAAVERMARRA